MAKTQISSKIEHMAYSVKGILKNYQLDYNKFEDCVKRMIQLENMKENHIMPSKKDMIKFVKDYKHILNFYIMREHNKEMRVKEFIPASYHQYILFEMYCKEKRNMVRLGTLPYKEINEILKLNEEDFEEYYCIEENILGDEI